MVPANHNREELASVARWQGGRCGPAWVNRYWLVLAEASRRAGTASSTNGSKARRAADRADRSRRVPEEGLLPMDFLWPV